MIYVCSDIHTTKYSGRIFEKYQKCWRCLIFYFIYFLIAGGARVNVLDQWDFTVGEAIHLECIMSVLPHLALHIWTLRSKYCWKRTLHWNHV